MSTLGLAGVQGRISQITAGMAPRVPLGATAFGDVLAAKTTPSTSEPAETVDQEGRVALDGFATPDAAPAPTTVATLGTMLGGTQATMLSTPLSLALPEHGRQWAGAITGAARGAGLDPRLLAAVVWAESGFDPDAVSSAGAIGLTQLMPATAAGLDVDPTDPAQNLAGGARYLAWTIEEFGSVELGLAAYNAGPGAVRNAGGVPDIAETRTYVPKVLDLYRRLGGIR